MKKIVIMSDNHGDDQALELVKRLEPAADYYIHCGDSETYNFALLNEYYSVKGNNDWHLNLPTQLTMEIEGYKVLVTHGQYFGYFNREYAMNDLLTQNHAQILICGHTHMPMFMQDGDYYYVNPGSTSFPRGGSKKSYGVLLLDNHHVEFILKKL